MKPRAALLAFLALCFTAAAGADGIGVETRVWPKSITVGGETKVAVRITHPKGVTPKLPAETLKVEPFEIKAVSASSPQETAGGVRESFFLTVTAFETGELTFPAIALSYETASGAGGTVWTKPLKVTVVPVTKPTDKKMKPIKGVVSFGRGALQALLFGSAALVLAVILFLRLRRRTGKTKIDPETLKPPHERALLELGRLEKMEDVEGRQKDFYGGLSQILKAYLTRRYGFQAADLTTSEILAETKGGPMDELARRALKDALDEADLVKFANLAPDRAGLSRSADRVRDIVARTKPDEDQKAEEAG